MEQLPNSQLANLLSQYRMSFGSIVPRTILKTENPSMIASQILTALKKKEPIEAWLELLKTESKMNLRRT